MMKAFYVSIGIIFGFYCTLLPANEIKLTPCVVTLDGDQQEYPAECGHIWVAENRSTPASPLIKLPITRIPALQKEANNPPVFWLDGGPGSVNWMNYPTDNLLQTHDLVIVGYRGIEGDRILQCDAIRPALAKAASFFSQPESKKLLAQGVADCATQIQGAGIDLNGYTQSETVADMEQARSALGYSKIILFGNSYGTRLALLYLWRFPDSIERALLVAVNPPGHLRWDSQTTDELIYAYQQLCQHDVQCQQRLPDLTTTFVSVIKNAPTHWYGLPIHMDAVRLLTFFALMESEPVDGALVPLNAQAIFLVWHQAEQGDYSAMATISILADKLFPSIFNWEHFIALGGSAPDYRQDHVADYANGLIGNPVSELLDSMTESWPVVDIDAPTKAKNSNVPVLFVSGSLDGSTPAKFTTNELLPLFKQGQQVILKNFAHTESIWQNQPVARQRLFSKFLDNGEVDASLYHPQEIHFQPAYQWKHIGYLIAVIGLTSVLLLLWLLRSLLRGLRRLRNNKVSGF